MALDYDQRLQILLGAAEASAKRDIDAEWAIEAAVDVQDHEAEFGFHAAFCRRAGEHVIEFGAERVGRAIGYAFGVQTAHWHDIDKVPTAVGRDALFALFDLYRDCFARHLPGAGHVVGGAGDPLGMSCYMLWDMDGGLESIPMFGKPAELVDPCFHVLEQALTLASEPCWESALHGLGHIQPYHTARTQRIIDRFVRRQGRALPEHIAEYAGAAREGLVQ